MQIVIYTLVLFVFISLVFKLSFWKIHYSFIFGAALGLFVYFIFPIASEQSKTAFEALLNDTKILGDMAVFVLLEAAIILSYCIVGFLHKSNNRTKKWLQILKYYPGFLAFPLVFYLLSQLFFSLTGVDFKTIALGFGGACFVLVPLVSFVVNKWMPDEEQRREILLMTNVFIVLLGLVATANGKMTYSPQHETIALDKIILSVVLFIGLFTLGFVLNRLKWKLHNKKSINNNNQ
jgi:hypothetical protein